MAQPNTVRAFGDWYCQPHQDGLWDYLDAGGLRACAVWHRRAGKDDVALHRTFKAAHQRVGNYWHMLPQAAQARKAIWDAINPHTGIRRIDEAFPQRSRRRTRNNEMMIEFLNGSIWQVVGSDNFNALVGSPPIGIVFSEWSLADPHAWAYMRPILRENGGWAIFIYTPRGRNHGLTLYNAAKAAQGWYCETLPANKTDVFTPAELEEERAELIAEYGADLGQNLFEQEYLCSFDAAILGAIYAKWIRQLEQSGRVATVEYDPALPVNTAWDIGFSDATAIWFFQIAGREVHLIDFLKATGQDAQFYCEQLLGYELELTQGGRVLKGEPIEAAAHRVDWQYGKHWAPHDAAHKTIAAGGRSFGDQCYAYGITLEIVAAVSQQAQIDAARRTLEFSYFDEARCKDGLDALSSYHYEWDDDLKMLKPKPLHDWSSHPSDAFEIIGQVWQPIRTKRERPKPRFLDQVTADEVFFPKDRRGPKIERL